jgi:tRNA G18 (ribose-2'-O)-methylase SpoU
LLLPIDSPTDPRVADYRAIPEPELLRRRGLFVAEGRLVVRKLLASACFRTRSLLLNPAALDSVRDALDVEASPLDVFVASAETLAEMTGFHFHRGCLALGERPPESGPAALSLDRSRSSLVVVLEGLSQADNVGSVFRNAAAFGVAAVLLDPACCDPLYRKALRTSMGTILHVPFARMTDTATDLGRLRDMGYRLVALTPSAAACPIDRLAERLADTRIALLVGTEGTGLSAALEAMADDRVTIPIAADVNSLNVATATGIALHRLGR